MRPAPRKQLSLGDPLQVTVVKPLGGKRFFAVCKGVPQGWKVELHTRNPEKVELGANHSCWIARIVPLKMSVLVHDGDFGRLPISETMKSRYLAALRALLEPGQISGDQLADARSMIVRIEQKNQADWLSVWKSLGEPATGDVKELLQGVDAIRATRKDEPEKLETVQSAFIAKYLDRIETAIERLDR